MSQETIWAIGNSHVNIFSGREDGFHSPGESEGFKSFPIGPTIAYNFFENHYPKVLKIINEFRLPIKSKILLVVGEVDCRWHMPYQAYVQKKSTNQIIEECVSRFFRTFIALRELNYVPICWGTHPTTTGLHNNDENQPVFGDVIYRNGICVYWNLLLKEMCEKNNFEFKSIYKNLVNQYNITDMSYYQDYCHLNNKVLPFLHKEFNIKHG